MGGDGSGSWWPRAKWTVERCLGLDINWLVRWGIIVPRRASGVLRWSPRVMGGAGSAVAYWLEPLSNVPPYTHRLILEYALGTGGGRVKVKQPIFVQTTKPNFGGVRYWLTCTLMANGQCCGRRVGKLYLPPGSDYFGCRHCHDLTYRSCRESHEVDKWHAERDREFTELRQRALRRSPQWRAAVKKLIEDIKRSLATEHPVSDRNRLHQTVQGQAGDHSGNAGPDRDY